MATATELKLKTGVSYATDATVHYSYNEEGPNITQWILAPAIRDMIIEGHSALDMADACMDGISEIIINLPNPHNKAVTFHRGDSSDDPEYWSEIGVSDKELVLSNKRFYFRAISDDYEYYVESGSYKVDSISE